MQGEHGSKEDWEALRWGKSLEDCARIGLVSEKKSTPPFTSIYPDDSLVKVLVQIRRETQRIEKAIMNYGCIFNEMSWWSEAAVMKFRYE